MRDRIVNRLRPAAGTAGGRSAAAPQRRLTRRERELRQRRLLYIVTGIAGVIVVLALIIGAAYQYYFFPRHALASVSGEEIERRDYWKVREFQLLQQVSQLSQQAQFVSADQRQEIVQRIQLAQEELENLQDAPIASDTLSTMVDNLVVLQNVEELGVTITEEDIDQFIDEQFAPVPLAEPTATPTVEPTAAAWATQTAEAQNAQMTETAEASATAVQQTATALGTPPAAESEATGTVTETVTAEATDEAAAGTPEATETGEAAATPGEGTPVATETPTPSAEEALATSEAQFERFEEGFLEEVDMSRSDYERLIVRPAVAREKARDVLVNQLPVRAEQVHAAHILLATREAADEVKTRLETEDFAAVAQQVSTDTTTAGTGGDLGWFPRGLMPDTFDDVAFGLEPGQVSDPVQTEFGWHVIKVLEKEQDRPISIATLRTLQGEVFDEWLDQQRAESEIEADILLPDPAAAEDTPQTFQAPPDAPLPPTPTTAPPPVEAPTIVPEGTDTGTPEAGETPTP